LAATHPGLLPEALVAPAGLELSAAERMTKCNGAAVYIYLILFTIL
jgi:hypothetical protein